MTKRLFFYLTVTGFLFQACKEVPLQKTPSGLTYKIFSKGEGKPAQRGQYLKLYFTQRLVGNNRDTALGGNYGKMPAYSRIDSVGSVHNPTEIFSLLRKGDSALVIMQADTLMKKHPGLLPPYIKAKDKIQVGFKVLDVLAESAVNKDQVAENDKEKKRIKAQSEVMLAKDDQTLQAYLNKQKIRAAKTAKGAYYDIQSTQNGAQADSGKIVSINYTGYTLDGRYFDSNIDSTKQLQKHPLQPFTFVAGGYGAIPGMLEGITYFKKGDKGRLFIPSSLAYGENPPPGSSIKPHEILVFDIEVVDLKEKPKSPSSPK